MSGEKAELALQDLDGLAILRRLLNSGNSTKLALVSSFGSESVVLLDMVASVCRQTPVLFLDTGKHFSETEQYFRELCSFFDLTDVRTIRPDSQILSVHDSDGKLNRSDPDFCCHLRKTEPLYLALEEFDGWITGRKRFHGGLRKDLPVVEFDEQSSRLKINPLARWTLEDITHYRRLRQLPLHPLLSSGYTSVGCEPCTVKNTDANRPRDGRWSGMDKTECGIHLASGI